MIEYLFVYGTLLKDINNDMSQFLANNAEFYSKGFFHGKLYNVSYYPGAITSSDISKRVYGNIYKITESESLFNVLDKYEEVGENFPKPNEYTREKITVYSQIGEKLNAWMYLYNHSVTDLREIVSGDFLKGS